MNIKIKFSICLCIFVLIVVIVGRAYNYNYTAKVSVDTPEEAVEVTKKILGDKEEIKFAYTVFDAEDNWYVITNYDFNYNNHKNYYEGKDVSNDVFTGIYLGTIRVRKKDGKIIEKSFEEQEGPKIVNPSLIK